MSFEVFLTYQKMVTFWTYAGESGTTLSGCLCDVSHPHGNVRWSTVRYCDNLWSYSLTGCWHSNGNLLMLVANMFYFVI